jgi:ATP-dependent DNA helicase 2 subunit 1
MVKLDAETNEVVKTESSWLCPTGATLREDQIKTFFPYGGQKVYFTKSEMKTIKTFGSPGLTLLGFKPQAMIKTYHRSKNPYFIYPDEGAVSGSIVAFNALLQQMAARQVVAIARLIMRASSGPVFVACLPQLEVVDAHTGLQEKPPGMHMIFLPFADDIRELKVPPMNIAGPELIAEASKIVKGNLMKQEVSMVDNPDLARHFMKVEAIVFNEGLDADKFNQDDTLPDPELMAENEELFARFADMAGLNAPQLTAAAKRKRDAAAATAAAIANGDEPPPAAKRAKKAVADVSDDVIVDAARNNTLATFTMPVLKAFLKAKGLPLSGKKDDLCARVTDFINNI